VRKTQLKAIAIKIHGLAVKSASGRKPAQNKALEKIATLLNQAIEAEIKQAYAGIASQIRGLAEKLEPAPARKAVKRKKVTRKKPVATKKKPAVRRVGSNPPRRWQSKQGLLETHSLNQGAGLSSSIIDRVALRPTQGIQYLYPLFEEGAINGDVTVLCCGSRVDFLSRPAEL
jgi:hypothetical protein